MDAYQMMLREAEQAQLQGRYWDWVELQNQKNLFEEKNVHPAASSAVPGGHIGIGDLKRQQIYSLAKIAKNSNESQHIIIRVKVPPSLHGDSWTHLGYEGTSHDVPRGGTVRYGIDGHWIEKVVRSDGTATVIAGNDYFGVDPAPNITKELMVKGTLTGAVVSDFRVTVHPDGSETWDKFTKKSDSNTRKKGEFLYKLDGQDDWITFTELDRPNVSFAMRVEQEARRRIRVAAEERLAKEKREAEEAVKSRVLERKRIEAEQFEEAVRRSMANM